MKSRKRNLEKQLVRLGKCAIIFYKYTTYNKDWGNRMKKILFASSEAVPFIKTGGLADVVGSLPKYFPKNEYDVRVWFRSTCAWTVNTQKR